MVFTATAPELQIVAALFEAGDPSRTGIITADNAVPLLSTAHLPGDVLGQIWAIADSDNNGFLTRKSASIVVRLIGWVQKGEPVSEDLLNRGACVRRHRLFICERLGPVQWDHYRPSTDSSWLSLLALNHPVQHLSPRLLCPL